MENIKRSRICIVEKNAPEIIMNWCCVSSFAFICRIANLILFAPFNSYWQIPVDRWYETSDGKALRIGVTFKDSNSDWMTRFHFFSWSHQPHAFLKKAGILEFKKMYRKRLKNSRSWAMARIRWGIFLLSLKFCVALTGKSGNHFIKDINSHLYF